MVRWLPKSSPPRHGVARQRAPLSEMWQLLLTSLEVSLFPPPPSHGGDYAWDSIPRGRGDLSNGQKLTKTCFPASETLAWEGRCDQSGLVWKPRQETKKRRLKEGRAAWLFFLITSWSLFCWNISCSSLVNRAELVRSEWQNHLIGISSSWRSAMCRGSQRTGQPVLSALWLAGLVFCKLPEISWRKNLCKTWMPGVLNDRHLYAHPEALSHLNTKQFLLSLILSRHYYQITTLQQSLCKTLKSRLCVPGSHCSPNFTKYLLDSLYRWFSPGVVNGITCSPMDS